MSLLIVGSIALDTVKTPVEEHGDLLGGSASYAAAAASYFSPVNLVGVVGSDFPEAEFDFWRSRKIDAKGVQRAEGKTFRWSGEYSWDLNTRETRSVALNVFEDFKPELPKSYRHSDFERQRSARDDEGDKPDQGRPRHWRNGSALHCDQKGRARRTVVWRKRVF